MFFRSPPFIPSPTGGGTIGIQAKIVKKIIEICNDKIEQKIGKRLLGSTKKWSFVDSPEPGSHIRVRRAKVLGWAVPGDYIMSKVLDGHGINFYEHHGIYIGDGKVIHFAARGGDFSTDIKIRKTTLEKFLDGGELEFRDFDAVDNDQRYSNDMVVKRAMRVLKSQNFGSYNLLTNNCEHFANYCVFGKKFSEQVLGSEPD